MKQKNIRTAYFLFFLILSIWIEKNFPLYGLSLWIALFFGAELSMVLIWLSSLILDTVFLLPIGSSALFLFGLGFLKDILRFKPYGLVVLFIIACLSIFILDGTLLSSHFLVIFLLGICVAAVRRFLPML